MKYRIQKAVGVDYVEADYVYVEGGVLIITIGPWPKREMIGMYSRHYWLKVEPVNEVG